MTEHRRYVDLAATAIDLPLDPRNDHDLRAHLATCTACRRRADALRADASAIGAIDFGPAPVMVRDRVAAAAMAGTPSSPRLLLLVATGLLLMLAVFAGSAAVGAFLSQRPTLDLSLADKVSWKTDVVALRALDLWIDAGGTRYTPVGKQVKVTSDRGKLDFQTLESTWQEHGREMRPLLYFGGDATSWWVSEIRTYDGSANPKWAGTKGTLFRSPLNQAWAGNVDLELISDVGGSGPVKVHIERLQLATTPKANVVDPPVGVPPKLIKSNPFVRGAELHCSGVFQQRPDDAEKNLLGMGYRLSWRFVVNDFSKPTLTPPDGVIYDAAAGSDGELIIFVAPKDQVPAIPPIEFSDCPNIDAPPVPKPT